MNEVSNKDNSQLDEELNRLLKNQDSAFFGPSVVSEAASLYNYTPLSKEITFDSFLEDKLLMVKAIRAGIPYSFFDLIKENTPFSENDWADYLDISTKTLQRYKASKDHSFKSIYSEKIIELAEVTKLGLEVFGDMEKFKLWLNTPNYALGNSLPMSLLKDSYGKELVMGELTRIDHGILV